MRSSPRRAVRRKVIAAGLNENGTAVSRNEESCSGDKARTRSRSHRDCQRETVSMSRSRQMCSKHCAAARRESALTQCHSCRVSLPLSLYLSFFFASSASISLWLFVYVLYEHNDLLQGRGREYTRLCQKCIDPEAGAIPFRALILRHDAEYRSIKRRWIHRGSSFGSAASRNADADQIKRPITHNVYI